MRHSTLGGEGESSRIMLGHDLFASIAKAHDCSTGVVSLSWAVQRGVTVIPKSSSKSRIEDNAKLVTLTDEEMDRINNAYKTLGQRRTADNYPLWTERDGKRLILGWTLVEMGWEDEEGDWLL